MNVGPMHKTSAWLVIEVEYLRGEWRPKITKVRKNRPVNQMAIEVTLEIPDEVLRPKVQALVDAGQIQIEIEEPEE